MAFMQHLTNGLVSFYDTVITETKENNAVLKFIAIFASAILFIYWIFVHPFLLFKRQGIPYVTPLPLLGSVLEIAKGSYKFHMRCMKEIGKVYGFYAGRRPVLTITDDKLLEQVFVKQFGNFHNRPSFLAKKRPPMDMGLLIVDYKDWRRIRLTVNPTFSAGKMRQMIPLIEEATNTLVSVLAEFSKGKKNTTLHEIFGRMTMDIILSVAFGRKTDFQLKKNLKITNEAAKWFVVEKKFLLVDILPFPMAFREWVRLFFAPDPAIFVDLLKPIVEDRRLVPSNRKDFLQLLLSEDRTDGKPKLSDADIYATAITFLLAGYETTSNALSFTTYLLALHPDIQERLHKEIVEQFNEDSDSLYDEVLKLEYLDQVLSESLRMYPPAYQTARLVSEDCEVGGYRIPKGITINIPVYAIHHFEEYWKDPFTFDPERFNAENRPNINPLHYLPFGYGPRNCVGMRFALVEAKLALAKMLKAFKFVQTPDTEIPLKITFGVTMTPTNGIKVDIVPRVVRQKEKEIEA